eukprot:COSAG01_NODE_43566_length_428_cov_1.784195_1_plen_54_part_01
MSLTLRVLGNTGLALRIIIKCVLYFSDNLRLQDGGCCRFEAADLCCCSPGAPER